MNDRCPLKMRPVNFWLKDQRISVLLPDPPLQLTIQCQVQILAAMRTAGLNLN